MELNGQEIKRIRYLPTTSKFDQSDRPWLYPGPCTRGTNTTRLKIYFTSFLFYGATQAVRHAIPLNGRQWLTGSPSSEISNSGAVILTHTLIGLRALENNVSSLNA